MTKNIYNTGDDALDFLKKHTGKIATFLGALGVASSILISAHLIVASGIVLGITNLAIIAGGVVFEKIQLENDKINSENENLKIYNKRLSEWKMKTESELSSNNDDNNDEIIINKKDKDTLDSIYYGLTVNGLNMNCSVRNTVNTKNTPDA